MFTQPLITDSLDIFQTQLKTVIYVIMISITVIVYFKAFLALLNENNYVKAGVLFFAGSFIAALTQIEFILAHWKIALMVLAVIVALVAISFVIAIRGENPHENGEEVYEQAGRAEKPFNNLASEWATLLKRYHEVDQRFLAYDKDLNLLLKYPLLRDYRQPETVALVNAMSDCRPLVTEKPPKDVKTIKESGLFKAVEVYERALDRAENLAKIVFDSRMSEKERVALRNAQQLLAVVENEASTPAERATAYERVIKVLKDVLPVPAAARKELESRYSLRAITSGV